MMHWEMHQQSSGSPLLSGQLVRCCLEKKSSTLTNIFVFFCLRSEVCNCKEL